MSAAAYRSSLGTRVSNPALCVEKESVHFEFLYQRVMSEFFPNVGHVTLGHIIAGHARKMIFRAEPSLLQFVLKAALDYGMMSELTHINCTQSVDLSCDRILFDQRFFRESELQWIISRQ